MSEEKKYAIRCSTEEQARECEGYKVFNYEGGYSNRLKEKGYTIITYSEALSLGFLGETSDEFESRQCTENEYRERKDNKEPQKVEVVKESPSEDNLVEKIMEEWIDTHGEQRAIYWREMENLLKKFLSK